MKERTIELGLCKGRHNIQGVEQYIFENTLDPTNLKYMQEKALETINKYSSDVDYLYLDLYVTGLTVATTSVINAVLDHNRTYKNRVILTLYHYNKDTDTYYPQQILDQELNIMERLVISRIGDKLDGFVKSPNGIIIKVFIHNNNVRMFDVLDISVEEYNNSLKNTKYRPTEIDNMNELTLLKLFRDNKGWN